MKKRGQASVEYVIIVGVILVALIPLFFYSLNKVNQEIKISEADDTVNSVANAADIVYSLGTGTRKYIQITIPSGVVESVVNGTLVMLKVNVYGSVSDFYADTIPIISGTLPMEKGTYTIVLESLEDGTVRIGSYNDTSAPQVVWKSPNGTLEVQSITLLANTNENAHCRYAQADTAYTSMSSDFSGELITHDYSLGLLLQGNYTYYARCKDTMGNIMQNSSIISFSLIINTSSNLRPSINLEGPPNGTIKNFNLVQFAYNVSSSIADIALCALRITGASQGGAADQTITDGSITENATQSLSTSLAKGNYTWWVNCTDNSALFNTNMSEIRALKINSTEGETYITSCQGWCGFNGFSTGICENNIPKCNNNCGLPYSQTRDCYAGTTVSTDYCTGGSESDTCCCIL